MDTDTAQHTTTFWKARKAQGFTRARHGDRTVTIRRVTTASVFVKHDGHDGVTAVHPADLRP